MSYMFLWEDVYRSRYFLALFLILPHNGFKTALAYSTLQNGGNELKWQVF